jgi:hypothetical protein
LKKTAVWSINTHPHSADSCSPAFSNKIPSLPSQRVRGQSIRTRSPISGCVLYGSCITTPGSRCRRLCSCSAGRWWPSPDTGGCQRCDRAGWCRGPRGRVGRRSDPAPSPRSSPPLGWRTSLDGMGRLRLPSAGRLPATPVLVSPWVPTLNKREQLSCRPSRSVGT